jgi:hydrogenase nickel incorporation protein HypA/HybF
MVLMHELSIALSIVDIACEESRRLGNAQLKAVHLKLGPLSGVVKDALLFSWQLACEETPAAGSRLEIEEVPVTVWCKACDAERTPESPLDFRCPVCQGTAIEVRSGAELQVCALEIEDG